MSATGGKENNKNAINTGYKGVKRFLGGNTNLQGKIFEISAKDAVHQFADTVKAIADYVGQEYTHGGDIRFMIENMEDYNFVRPADPAANANEYEKESWKKQLDLFWKRRGIYMDNKMKLYSLIWGQSSKTTQSKLETHMNFNRCKNEYDSLGLLKIIREFVFKSDDRQYKYKAEDQAKRAYYNLRQTPEMSCQEYFERVRNIVEVIKSLGGSLSDDMHLQDELPAREPARGYTEAQKQEAREKILEKKVAYGILIRADRGRYGKLIEEIENDYLKGNNDYPQTPTEAYNLLVNYKNYNNVKRTAPGLDQVAFMADGKRTKTDKQHPHIQCFKCKQYGHYKSDCPGKEASEQTQVITATTLMTRATVMAASQEEIDSMWVLCDNESTVDIVKNPIMITNLRKAKHPIELTGIKGGPTKINIEGDLPGYGTVYYHPDVAANILSFYNLTKRFKSVRYDNQVKDAFIVTRDDNTIMEFAPSKEGLYHYNFLESINRQRQIPQTVVPAQTMMIQTVEEIKRKFSKRELDSAEEARRLYVIVGRPGRNTFEEMLKKGHLVNNTVTVQDYRNAIQIYGEDLGVLKGKTTRSKPERISIDTTVEQPEKKHLVLSVDLMYFTGIPFLITVCRNIIFLTATALPDRKKGTIMQALRQVFKLYQGKGHRVDSIDFTENDTPIHSILADNEFQVMKDEIETDGVNVHIVAKEEHVPEVERQNRVVKERARAIVQTLPYKRMPRKMRIALIQYVIFWLNNIPKEGQVYTPKDMIMGKQILDTKHICKLPFGAYAQVHEDPTVTNTMEPRTTGGVNLGPSNMQGAHRFLNLSTGEIITRRKWTELPVPSEVILRLEEMSQDPNDNVEYILNDDISETETEETNEHTNEEEGSEHEVDTVRNREEHGEELTVEVPMEEEHRNSEENAAINELIESDHPTEPIDFHSEGENDNAVNTSIVSQETVRTDNLTTKPQHSRYNLRPNRTPNYLRRFAFLSVKAGIKKWGDRAREAVREELRMFIKEKVFKGLRKPTRAQMERALMIHCFVIEKRDGRIKARAVADGRTQQRYTEEETYSPTVRLESLLLSCMIDAFEKRHVATVDIKGAFLKAPVPEELELIVKMSGEMAQLMCELDDNLECDEHGCIYLQCEKALYGHIEAARLFYNNLNQSLTTKMGFTQNKYDPCVYNKRTKEGSTTIRVHVDDLKISARSRKQLLTTIQQLKEIYGELTVNIGMEHDYLGMQITYHPDKQSVTINMKSYIEGCIEEFEQENPEIKMKTVATPATENLFKVRKGAEREPLLLSKSRAMIFHSTVAKLLFLSKRGRPDILLAVSFLTTRVKTPDEDDWKKLIRVLSYLKGTLEMSLTLTCTSMNALTWYIDGSYAIHEDMKGQNGAVLMLGDNVVLSRSSKQKVNTRSSTESELIAIDDALPTVQWARNFMIEQGYDLTTLIKEDNRSTILLMKNGRLSAGKRTKHLDIRYFYVRDLIERGIVQVEHCTTDEMVADFFTKPIQGRKFQVFRDMILNHGNSSALQYRSVLDNINKEDIVTADDQDSLNKHRDLKESRERDKDRPVSGDMGD